MKKLILILLSFYVFGNEVLAQIPEIVDANTFCSNPKRFNGKTITVKNVILKNLNANINSTFNSSPTLCNAPKGSKSLNIEFPDPKYTGCFVINQQLISNLNNNRDLRVTITFKVDVSNFNIISTIFTQP